MVKIEDFNTHLYTEIINIISRNNNDLLNDAIKAAELEAIGYLSRFDTEVLFSKEDSERDAVLMMYLKDMAIWHFIPVANPSIDIDYREMRYKNAIKWLEKIQVGKIVPKEWITANQDNENQSDNSILVSSAPRRETRW